jgi:hypothetical protein
MTLFLTRSYPSSNGNGNEHNNDDKADSQRKFGGHVEPPTLDFASLRFFIYCRM